MDLEELLQAEGLDAERLKDTVEWARGRADELVSGLIADAELGPLLDAQWEDEGSQPIRLSELAGAPAPSPSEDDGGELEERASPVGELQARDPAVPHEPAHEDVTQPRALSPGREDSRPNLPLPPIPGTPRTVAPATTDEIVDDEIELLDDDDLELVEDSLTRGRIPSDDPGEDPGEDDVPEWKRALSSAQMGGGAQADHDSGLWRMNGPGGAPEKVGGAPEPATSEGSVEVDLNDDEDEED